MADRRRANVNWLVTDEAGKILSVDHANLAVLMDIRDEFRRLNALLHCENFQRIPRTLKGIQRKLPTPTRKGQS